MSGICFRFMDDLTLVVTAEKKLLSIADFAHQCCTVHGVANFTLANHELVQKQYPVTLFSFCELFAFACFDDPGYVDLLLRLGV